MHIIVITPYDICAYDFSMHYGLGRISDNIDNCNQRTHVCSRCVHTNESCLWLCDCSRHTPKIDQLSIFWTGSTGPPLVRLQKKTSSSRCFYWLFRQWVIPPDMGPQGIPWWAEFLTILTIVTRRNMFGLHMLIKMGLSSSQVATVSAGPWAIYFGHFGLNQSLKISCKTTSNSWNINSFLEWGGFVKRGSSRHFWTDNVYRNAYMCNLDCQHAYSQRVQTFPACPLQCNHSQHISKTGLYQQSFPSTSSSQRRLKIRVRAYISNCAVG